MTAQRPILVIDDDPSILMTVTDILEDEGYFVETAKNGLEGLGKLDRIGPALVLLDMRMPVMDGWGFARKLKEREEHPPVLVMTAAQDASRWSKEIGADGFLAKPFDLNDLITCVSQYAD